MIGRADIEGSKSNVAMNAWLPQASYYTYGYPPSHQMYLLIFIGTVYSKSIVFISPHPTPILVPMTMLTILSPQEGVLPLVP